MPAKELADFHDYWELSMFKDGKVRNPGGDPELGGVDYSEYLIPWCKGNSVSVDQSTLRVPRDLFSLLIEKYKSRRKVTEGTRMRMGEQSGVTLSEIESKFGKYYTKVSKKGGYGVGYRTPEWISIESLLQQLLIWGDIALFSSSDTPVQAKTVDQIIANCTDRFQDTGSLVPLDENGQPLPGSTPIGDLMKKTEQDYGHIRISAMKKGWDTYIRDHYGAPGTGSLVGESSSLSNRSMPLPLHIVYAETIARVMHRGTPWGRNQTKIRRKLTDIVIEGDGSSVSLDEYYNEFDRHSAPHMADFFIGRSVGDIASAKYEIYEVPNSDPKSWRVRLDPDLIRWRENARERERGRQ